ncbi:olxA [Citrobacter werkmanii]|uniref:olxA n=1 Tax=Citrobacter werkmanii TaxID=67827 RepID=UPI0037C78ACA
MYTLIDTIQPGADYLESILPEALAGKAEEDWISLYLSNLAKRLALHPAQYRSFGPWWPALKDMLIASGYNQFGIMNDIGVAAIYRMPRPALTLVAAHLYSMERFDNGLVYEAHHTLEVNDTAADTEPYHWESYDDELEDTIAKGYVYKT